MRTAKFKDLFGFGQKSNIKAGDGLEKGRFPFYTSSPKLTKWIDREQHFDEALIFGTGGLASVHFEDQLSFHLNDRHKSFCMEQCETTIQNTSRTVLASGKTRHSEKKRSHAESRQRIRQDAP